ncbi:hypothetical protein [Leptospira brenneri]|uniref:hypothetical protein n=1 Tax=Leptospira brenneri TaxID=2023182 RepID=UPI000C2A6DA2|nr:hypothetical protein [Leptospira brenneri]PJZ45146.1 hypothetical protein CH361_13015 [Leptospira brenneri]
MNKLKYLGLFLFALSLGISANPRSAEKENLKNMFMDYYQYSPEILKFSFLDYLDRYPDDHYVRYRYANLLALDGKYYQAYQELERLNQKIQSDSIKISENDRISITSYRLFFLALFELEDSFVRNSIISKYSLTNKSIFSAETLVKSMEASCFPVDEWKNIDENIISRGWYSDYAKPTAFVFLLNFHSAYFNKCNNQVNSIKKSIEGSRLVKGYNFYLNFLYDMVLVDESLLSEFNLNKAKMQYNELRSRAYQEKLPTWVGDQLNYRLNLVCKKLHCDKRELDGYNSELLGIDGSVMRNRINTFLE